MAQKSYSSGEGIKRKLNYVYGLFFRTFKSIEEEHIYFLANGLAYRSLISLVPLLAFLFSFFALFKGAYDMNLETKIRYAISRYFLPESEASHKLIEQTMHFVERAKTGSFIGFLFLLGTLLALLNYIDRSLNIAWKTEKKRNWLQKMMIFTFILLWGPVILGISFYLTAKIQFRELLSHISTIHLATQLPLQSFLDRFFFVVSYISNYSLSFFLIFISLFFIFKIVPDTRVETRPAIWSALLVSVLWELTKWGFGEFATWTLQAREKIYAGFAVFFVFLVWMYLSWALVLFGARFGYIYQNYRYEIKASPRSPRSLNLSVLACQIMLEIGARFLKGLKPLSLNTLANIHQLGLPKLKEIFSALENAGLLAPLQSGSNSEIYYVPAKELENITLDKIVQAVDQSQLFVKKDEFLQGYDFVKNPEDGFAPELQKMLIDKLANIHEELRQSLEKISLKQLLESTCEQAKGTKSSS